MNTRKKRKIQKPHVSVLNQVVEEGTWRLGRGNGAVGGHDWVTEGAKGAQPDRPCTWMPDVAPNKVRQRTDTEVQFRVPVTLLTLNTSSSPSLANHISFERIFNIKRLSSHSTSSTARLLITLVVRP